MDLEETENIIPACEAEQVALDIEAVAHVRYSALNQVTLNFKNKG